MVASGYGPNLIVQLLSGGCITRLLHILGNSEIRSKRALIISYHLSLSFSTARWGSRPLREKIKVGANVLQFSIEPELKFIVVIDYAKTIPLKIIEPGTCPVCKFWMDSG
ncbi:uncharacterized protein LOC126659999 isoform X1 [Mercurialis annua]|uniref:uncharacterized protein LOC126659999 isoform X1 n=1 Tax=Mercurialis annua TaxID=3986 RepID=UPI00215E7861|nr:uncharacterized protein LOC126659999 isoform X1 [Mercurialis annua]